MGPIKPSLMYEATCEIQKQQMFARFSFLLLPQWQVSKGWRIMSETPEFQLLLRLFQEATDAFLAVIGQDEVHKLNKLEIKVLHDHAIWRSIQFNWLASN